MIKKTKILLISFSILILFTTSIIVYLSMTQTLTKEQIEKKQLLVSIAKMPDLAISTTASYIRNRSLSDTFSIYKDDPALREYFPSTFTYSQGIK